MMEMKLKEARAVAPSRCLWLEDAEGQHAIALKLCAEDYVEDEDEGADYREKIPVNINRRKLNCQTGCPGYTIRDIGRRVNLSVYRLMG